MGGMAKVVDGPARTGHTYLQPQNCESVLGPSLWFSLVVRFIGLVMKNIAISGTWLFAIPGGNITATIVDIDRACLWITSERLNADADTELDIYKKGLPGDPHETEDVSFSLKDSRSWIDPTGRYKFTPTAGCIHRTRCKACIMYKPARSYFYFTGGFFQERCW